MSSHRRRSDRRRWLPSLLALTLAAAGALTAATALAQANDTDGPRMEMSPPPPPDSPPPDSPPPPPEPPPPPPPEPPPPPPPEPSPSFDTPMDASPPVESKLPSSPDDDSGWGGSRDDDDDDDDDGKLPDRDDVGGGHGGHGGGGHGGHGDHDGHSGYMPGWDFDYPPPDLGCLDCVDPGDDAGSSSEAFAALDFDVIPESALVYVDGRLVGPADDFDGFPSYLWLFPGEHEVVVYKPGYRTIYRRYALVPGEIVALDDRMEKGETRSPSFYFRRGRPPSR